MAAGKGRIGGDSTKTRGGPERRLACDNKISASLSALRNAPITTRDKIFETGVRDGGVLALQKPDPAKVPCPWPTANQRALETLASITEARLRQSAVIAAAEQDLLTATPRGRE